MRLVTCLFVALVIVAPITISPAAAVDVLPGTQPLTWDGDLSLKMVDDLHKFADRETAASVERRARHWKRDFTSPEAYAKSIEPNRQRLAKYLGVSLSQSHDSRAEMIVAPNATGRYLWFGAVPVSVLRRPVGDWHTSVLRAVPQDLDPRATVIVLLDPNFGGNASQGTVNSYEFIRRMYAAGCQVLIVPVVDRAVELSVVANNARRTNQTHREFVYRQAFEMGRHVLGYEVDQVRYLINWVHNEYKDRPIGVFGFGIGGRIALLAGAISPGIDVTGDCGSFGSQQRLWEEPIDRNIWGYLDEFGDAELLSLIAPRRVVINVEATARYTEQKMPAGTNSSAAPGVLRVPELDEVRSEAKRAIALCPLLGESGTAAWTQTLIGDSDDESCLRAFLQGLGRSLPDDDDEARFQKTAKEASLFDFLGGHKVLALRQSELTTNLIAHTQALVRESEYVRKEFWKNADRASRDPEKWQASLKPYRDHLYDEVLGRFEKEKLPPNARTRKVYDTEKFTGYEVVLDVFGANANAVDVWAYGILLVPKDIKPGERRPVVVCQHGLEGRPQHTIDAAEPGENFYHHFAAQLAERGFVTFSPQNPYIGKDHFRQLVRKLYPLKKTLWSVIVPQHEQITDWLASLEFVDGERIGFYGLSYGGKTAMRVPALVNRYCLSICSGDFNEWIRKCTSVRDTFSYMGTHEYEMYEFDLGHTFNYAELAYLIAPRPFMVERGHRDGVGIDEWVAYEYAKVRMLYADLKIPERTEIEYFDGPHTIRGVGTFAFLHRHLNWPPPTN